MPADTRGPNEAGLRRDAFVPRLVSVVIPAFNAAEWIDAKSIARLARNGASGFFSTKRTVIGSTFSTLSTTSFMPMSSK